MRQVSPATNLLLACLAAAGLALSLQLPWFAPELVVDPASTEGPVEQAAARVAAVFATTPETVSAADAIAPARQLLVGLPALVAVLCAGMALAPLRDLLRDVVRAVALCVPAVVAYLVLVRPGVADGLAMHWGALASLAVAGFLTSAAWHGSALRPRRAPAGAWARAR